MPQLSGSRKRVGVVVVLDIEAAPDLAVVVHEAIAIGRHRFLLASMRETRQ
jgi:hypothetical protein